MSPLLKEMLTQAKSGDKSGNKPSKKIGNCRRRYRHLMDGQCSQITARSLRYLTSQMTLIAAGPKNHDEQDRQKEQDHRHRQLRRQSGSLLLRLRHAHVAIFLRQHTQRRGHRRAVTLRLLERKTD